MPEPLSLSTCLLLAQAIETTVPFDATSAFLLASELNGVADLSLPMILDSTLQEELDGIDDAELYRAAIARATINHLIIILRQMISNEEIDSTLETCRTE